MDDAEEIYIWRCFLMSIKQGFNALEIDYAILKDFCKKYGLEAIEVLVVARRLLGEYEQVIKDKKEG